MVGVEALNADVLSSIFCYLDVKDLLTVTRVSKDWKFVADQDFIWQNVIVSNLMNEGLPNELMKEIQKNIFKMRNLRKLTRQTWNGVVDACTGAIPKDLPLPSTSINMSHGPRFNDHNPYWKKVEDEDAGNGYAMMSFGFLWYFSVICTKQVFETGDYTIVWRMKLSSNSMISEMQFKIDSEHYFNLPMKDQEVRKGTGWFYVAIENQHLKEKEYKLQMINTTSIHQEYFIDCVIVLPSPLLDGCLPKENTIFLNK